MKEKIKYTFIVAIIIILIISIKLFLIDFVKISGSSMYPNLEDNQRVALLKFLPIKHNSVVVFDARGVDPQAKEHGNIYVKRVIGLPGDHLRYTSDGQLLINGKQQAQDYIVDDQKRQGTLEIAKNEVSSTHVNLTNDQDIVIPEGKYLVLGDNRAISRDSRYFGFVSKDKIEGVVYAFPWSDNHQLIN